MNYYCINLDKELIDYFTKYINKVDGKITGCSYVDGKYMFVYKSRYEIQESDIVDFKEETENECI